MIDDWLAYITGSTVKIRRRSGFFWKRTITDIGESGWNNKDPSSLTFGQIKKTGSWSTLSIYLGSALCKIMAVDLPSGVTDLNEQHAVAQAQMHRQLSIDPTDWVCTVDAILAPNKSVACAIRRDIFDRLNTVAAEKKLRLISVRPYITGIWNTFQKKYAGLPHSALLVIEKDALTVICTASGFIVAINTLGYRGEPAVIEREVRRLGMSLGSDSGQTVYLALAEKNQTYSGVGAGQLLNRADFLKPLRYADFRDLLFSDDGRTT